MRGVLADWAARQRGLGIDVALRDVSASGWPLAATVRYEADLGPAGTVGGLVITARLASSLGWSHPRTLRTDIAGFEVTGPAGRLEATAAEWVVESTLADPDAMRMLARDARFGWADHAVTVAVMTGQQIARPTGPRLLMDARDIDLARSGIALLPGLGPRIASLGVTAVLDGGWPVPAATAAASARAWREQGGALDVERLAAAYGPLDAAAHGRFALDPALRPSGEGAVSARGLTSLLDMLGGGGLIPPRAGQAAAGMLALLGGGEDRTTDIPFTLAAGRVSVAGIPVATLPRFAWESAQGP